MLFRSAAQDWKPVFPDTKGNYAKFEQFIRELEGTRTPNYGTDYQPPVGRKLRGGATGSFSGLVDDEASDE